MYFVVYLKDTQDILQGISKLDYLVKLSIFQRYKDSRLNRPDSLSFGGDTFVDREDSDIKQMDSLVSRESEAINE